MSQREQNKKIDLVEPFTGFMIATLNYRTVPSSPGGECLAKIGPRSANFNPDAEDVWYRNRVLMWVKCANGQYMAFLPETGWKVASKDQLSAIRIYNPGI